MAEMELPDVARAVLAEGETGGPSSEHIAAVFERYAALLTAGDAHGIVGLYAPDAVVRDPVNGPEVRGHEAIHAWYQGAFDTVGRLEMKLEGAVRVAGRYGAAAFVCRAIDQETPFRTDTLDVMRFDDEGRITSMDAYWGPANLHKL